MLPALLLAWSAVSAHASTDPAMDTDLERIEAECARIKYTIRDKGEQLTQIQSLLKDAVAIVARYPGRAEPLLWEGIVTGEEATLASVFRQLSLARDARALFERAEAIDSKALNGAITLSIGVIYYRVPGFPIGFGDDRKARHYLEAALATDPDGLDAGYYYGDFLMKEGEFDRARVVLEHALKAPVDASQPVWEAGRRGEIRTLLASIDRTAGR
jgi:tetratricopeptide (TPR) repeat protein